MFIFHLDMFNVKKIILIAFLMLVGFNVTACPKGEHPYGGTGPHHKGGYCAP